MKHTDPTGRGKGAVAQAVLGPTGQIEKIRVVSPGYGYLQAPDGSVGGNGILFADKGDTVLRDQEGNYYSFKPGQVFKHLLVAQSGSLLDHSRDSNL